MLPSIWQAQKTKNNLLLWLGLFSVVFILYSFFDILAHGNLTVMIASVGITIFIIHIIVNLTLALLTSSMLSLTQINLRLNKTEPKGSSSIPVLAFIFGLLTFGCTPCVIAFLAAIGIAFTPITFGAGNLLWKIILLILISLAYLYILHRLHHTKCPYKPHLKQTN